MNIYIPEFVLGVIVTVVIEVVALLAYSFSAYRKGKYKGNETT